MELKDDFRDFVMRTNENLRAIEELARCQRESEPKVFEVTQLINSLLGLIVFPHEAFPNRIPNERLDELARAGWPVPRVTVNTQGVGCETLRELYRRLRNGVAHWNLELLSVDHRITGLKLSDRAHRGAPPRLEVEMTVEELRALTRKFMGLVLA